MNKVVILRHKSSPISEEKMIPFLVRGLLDQLQKSTIVGNGIKSIDELLTKIKRMEA